MRRPVREATVIPERQAGLGLVEIIVGALLSTLVVASALLLTRQSLFGAQRMGEQLDLVREARQAETRLRRDLATTLAGGRLAVGPQNDALDLTFVVADAFDPTRAREIIVRYAVATGADGKARLMRDLQPLASAPARNVKFEQSPTAPGLLKVSFTLVGSRKGSEVICSFVWSVVPPLQSQAGSAVSTRPTTDSPSA